ncbi:MAG: sigma factor-like helix-turn-helix DNA-binding protein [Hespellia sp.]|nr:sigma factor-like helix-turn-helix DNA-binding protein [Hespellia sp.]
MQRESPKIQKKLDRLYERAENIPVVSGKVVGSSEYFPYTEVRTTVQMDEPRESDEVGKQIRLNELRLDSIERTKTEIEEFISGIPDSTDRQIFEMSFLEGKKMDEVGKEMGYTKGRISQKISGYLKD